MIKKNKLVLAANWETYTILKEKGVESILWEDCYDKNDLIDLNEHFRKFCNTWYLDEKGRDLSIYNGMSIGSAISMMLYYDLETWIRVFFLFEYLTSNQIDSTFFVLSNDYFPPQVYSYINRINDEYGLSIKIKTLECKDVGLEVDVKSLLSERRCLYPLRKGQSAGLLSFLNHVKNFAGRKKAKNIRCLVLQLRNSQQYIECYLGNPKLYSNLHLFFDSHFFRREGHW